MKSRFIIIAFSFLLSSRPNTGFCQQDEIAKNFLSHILSQRYAEAWKQVDVQITSGLTYEGFVEFSAGIYDLGKQYDTLIELYSRGEMFGQNGVSYITYSFNFFRDISEPPAVILDIIFVDSTSDLIAGIKPKFMMGGTEPAEKSNKISKADEESLEGKQKWTITDVQYEIPEIVLVFFSNNESALVIKVIKKLDKDLTMEVAEKLGEPFAKYAYQKNYIKKAEKKAKKIDRTLIEEIGVAFIDPESGMIYRVLIPKEIYIK